MLTFTKANEKCNHIHFIGIGGISMSGLAEICLDAGYKVSGSDMKSSYTLDRLKNKGANIFINHDKKNVFGADMVVYTSAISENNPELLESVNNDITIVDRATFLGSIMQNYNDSIAVSGTHGKTTTTGMLASILYNSPINPTILLGGNMGCINGNIQIGDTKLLLTEACEYKSNFLKFHPSIEIILNIDKDHMDYFSSIEHIIDTFREFVQKLPVDGSLIINGDDENCMKLIDNLKCSCFTFGINKSCNYLAEDISIGQNTSSYVLNINNKVRKKVVLKSMGVHNIYNSLAAIATAHVYGLNIDYIVSKISEFDGTERRFEFKGITNNITIIDDYAHHPTAVKATLNSAREIKHNKLYCIFQPHTYTRTYELLNEFSEAFYNCDNVIITDIYAAREIDNGLVHSNHLVDKLKSNGVNANYIKNFDDIKKHILSNCTDGDIVITMGAGNIYEVGNKLMNSFKKGANI
ncbi:UDP-N-acetylmuramate--L-alanine ligase [Clostridiaceae bacterium M8S5]|nr:UDP-N-acetylmuramate--L-alanine ligase [Clostridiaceae bacterium M8S5]